MEATLKSPYGQTNLEPTPYPYTIGRAPENQLVVNDPRVSSHHAQIRPEGQGYVIIDLGSSNGTFVNEQRLVPNVPRLLYTGDEVRIGDTKFVYEARAMSQPSFEPTAYSGFSQGSNPSYSPMVATPPPYVGESYGLPQGGYAPYQPAPVPVAVQAPLKKPSRRGLWITLSAIVGVLLLGAIVLGVFGYVNRSTPTKTLNAFCSALKSGDYQTAYNQLSSGLQAKFGSEAQFAAAFSNNGGLGKIHDCTVSNVDDGAGTGTISYALTGGSGSTLVVDYTLNDENGSSKINAQHPRSTPSLTLTTYCNALVMEDYQTAYNQYSNAVQSQIGTEAQFAAGATSTKIKNCTVSNVNDTTGTGTVTYLRGDGNTVSANETLVKENDAWKINAQQFISTPTETLLTYCSALKSQDYQTAYDQLSSSQHSQQSEAQFAANFNGIKVTECTVTNVNDTAGTGTINYTLSNGSAVVRVVLDYTLVNENGAWKINSEQKHA
jgi:limonene-1,2-epoxide hydrolase